MARLTKLMTIISSLPHLMMRAPQALFEWGTSSLQRRQCPLICDQYGYMIAATQLYRVDVNAGTLTLIKGPVGDGSRTNAMGYNTLDNYLYAWQEGHNWVIRMAGDGTATNITQLTYNNSPNMADFDEQGHYWYANYGYTYGILDLKPNSSTYGKLLQSGSVKTTPYPYIVADWCYVPSTGRYLWSVGTNDTTDTMAVLRFDMNTLAWDSVYTYKPFNASIFGAVYGINNGTIFASDNSYGNVYGFRLNSSAYPWLSTKIAPTSSNDGARCVYNLLGG